MTPRILAADPDPDVVGALKIYFAGREIPVETVNQAGEVIKVARLKQPNAVILSSDFTDADPFRVCTELLSDPLTAHIPIIMLLHLNDRALRLRALDAGVNDIVTKPFDLEELALRVEATIRLASFYTSREAK